MSTAQPPPKRRPHKADHSAKKGLWAYLFSCAPEDPLDTILERYWGAHEEASFGAQKDADLEGFMKAILEEKPKHAKVTFPKPQPPKEKEAREKWELETKDVKAWELMDSELWKEGMFREEVVLNEVTQTKEVKKSDDGKVMYCRRALPWDRRYALKNKYGMLVTDSLEPVNPQGMLLGLADPSVQDQLWKADAMQKSAIYDQFYTFGCWYCPVACNLMCPWNDWTHLEDHMANGTAQQMTCGPWCGDTGGDGGLGFKLPLYGRKDEIVIIASCPGDSHSYYTVQEAKAMRDKHGKDWADKMMDKVKTEEYKKEAMKARVKLRDIAKTPTEVWMESLVPKPAGGDSKVVKPEDDLGPAGVRLPCYIHSTFEEIAAKSDGRVIFCPIQRMTNADRQDPFYAERGFPAVNVKDDAISKDGGLGEIENGKGGVEYWLGYWVGNVREAIASASNKFWAKRIKVVAIFGGGPGSIGERERLATLGANDASKKTAKDATAGLFRCGMCCATCGAYYCCGKCCPGSRSAIYMAEAMVLRFAMCADPRDLEVEYMTVDALDLKAYLEDSSIKKLKAVKFENNRKVACCGCGGASAEVVEPEMKSPEQQTMGEGEREKDAQAKEEEEEKKPAGGMLGCATATALEVAQAAKAKVEEREREAGGAGEKSKANALMGCVTAKAVEVAKAAAEKAAEREKKEREEQEGSQEPEPEVTRQKKWAVAAPATEGSPDAAGTTPPATTTTTTSGSKSETPKKGAGAGEPTRNGSNRVHPFSSK